MHVESPWLVLILVPMAALIAWRSRPLHRAGRWLTRAATVLLCLATMGVQLRCERELRVVAWVDVSPSTRGAAFREPRSVEAKLRQLVPDRRVEIRSFADGPVTTSGESNSVRTRLPETDADAIVLMSDGRFDAPDALPPVFAVVDPALDTPADGRIVDAAIDAATMRIQAETSESNASLALAPGGSPVPVPAGPSAVAVPVQTGRVTATLAPSDAWPENNVMSALAEPAKDVAPWIVTEASQLPADASAYLGPPAIVVPASIELSAAQADRLTQYVRDLGGSLVMIGSPRSITPALRPISPLTGVPPTPEAEWMILLDASGSMASGARGDSRWDRALAAAMGAVDRLEPPQRVSIAVFARTAEMIATSVEPGEAIAKLRTLTTRAPTGPTGLDTALRSVAARPSASPTRLLLITDADATISTPDPLIDQLTNAKTGVFVLATGSITPDAAIRTIAQKTGGALIEQADSTQWSRAMQSLLDAADGDDRIEIAPLVLSGTLENARLEAGRFYRAFERPNVQTLARTPDHSIAATWQIGLGRVTSIAADVSESTMVGVADRLKRSPVDPRFSVSWDADAVVLRAAEAGRPVNGVSAVLLDGDSRLPLEQTAPGRYETRLSRLGLPRMVRVVAGEALIAAKALPGRYAAEFDRVGNDRASLESLARRTGGAVVEASNAQPLDLPRATELKPLTSILASLGLITLGAAIVFIRAPYLTGRIGRYARRSVR